MMKLAFLAIGAAAVALSAAPAEARHHHRHMVAYRVGYMFGPDYVYTDYGALPPPVVTRYHLRENFRYVNRNGIVYVVNPHSYRVVRVISVP